LSLPSPAVEQARADESQQVGKFVKRAGTSGWPAGIDPIEHGFHRSEPRPKIAVDACRPRVIGRHRRLVAKAAAVR